MHRYISYSIFLLAALTLASCAKSYSFPRAVYEGVQTRDHLQTLPTGQAGKPEPMNYQQYDAERKRQQ